MLAVRGFLQGVSSNQLSAELAWSYDSLLRLRHKFQDCVFWRNFLRPKLEGAVHESDEMYQNSGEKRKKTRRPRGPAAKAREQEARPRRLQG